MFDTVLMSGFVEETDFKELWLAYLDYLRRRISADPESGITELNEIETIFTNATTQMAEYFMGSESEYVITKYYTCFLARYKKDLKTAREYWKEIIGHGHKEKASIWLDYANFERRYGDADHYRKALLQALTYVSDWPETFLELLITFEREEGTLESLEKSLVRCETLMQNIERKRKKLEEAAILEKESKKRHSSKSSFKVSKNEDSSKPESYLSSPVKMDAEGFKIPPPPVKMHSLETDSKHDSQNHSEVKRRRSSPDRETSESKRRKSSPEEDQPDSKKRKETPEFRGASVSHDSSKDDRTVFVSNLSFKIDEDKLKEFFSQMGEVDEVRLVKDYKGRSKGFCYILYKTQAEAKVALSKDRELLDGRPVFISTCEDKKSSTSFQPKFKFGTGLERKKIFIKGLPFQTTKEDLENMYKEYGTVKDVRIVTYRNGHSKGLAYVEFQDEAAAANAVVKTDGTQMGESVISVAISNPPPRREKREFPVGSVSDSLGGGGTQAKGPRGRGRTQLSLVPRAVARKPPNKTHSDSSLQNGQNSSGESSKPLSNSDFAKMLQK